MRYIIYFAISVLMLAVVGCGKEGCQSAGGGTVALKPMAYKGNPAATLPYIETGKIHLREMGCQGNLCDMWAGLRPTIHNPLSKEIKVKITCQYWLDGVKFTEANPTKSVVVIGPASRKFEGFDLLFNSASGLRLDLAARCTAVFDGYPSVSSDATK